jgi:formylglycine-generating enzyme required for sulfatase activity
MHLPTEAEWEVACQKYAPEVPADANMQDTCLLEPQAPAPGNNQFYGDLWEWTSSAGHTPFILQPKERWKNIMESLW